MEEEEEGEEMTRLETESSSEGGCFLLPRTLDDADSEGAAAVVTVAGIIAGMREERDDAGTGGRS